MKKDNDIVVFYTEDIQDVFDHFMEFIHQTWSEASRGARSLEEALDILEDESFSPDLAIFDRGILRHAGDNVDDEQAGDQLYYELYDLEIPTAVLSGHSLEGTEPYRSKRRPTLGFYPKPTTKKALREAVEAFKRLDLSEG